MDAKIYEIWLSLCCTPDTATFSRLLESYSAAEEIYRATDREIRCAVGANSSDCSRLNNKDLTRAEEIYNFCTSKGVGLLSYFDESYPELLRDIPTPPVLLYYRGKLPNFARSFTCAVVGTRSLSDYGRINAFRFGYDMGMAGGTVVSGMAVGIDGVALAGALSAGAQTVAVLGSGIDVCYPAQHQTLARAIVKSGCVFTEFPPGTKPEKYNFPRRNRIISGLSRATVVVEGREGSGSMITAKYARAQNRDLYAYPGNVSSEGSQATNLLIKNGARLCTSAADVVYAYCEEVGTVLKPFNMKERLGVNMMEALTEYKVSCVTASDDIFKVPYTAKKVNDQPSPEPEKAGSPVAEQGTVGVADATALPAIDADALRIYKRIPMDVDCPIESLVDDKLDLRGVMKALLKLEMSRFVVILPGDRVKRNLR